MKFCRGGGKGFQGGERDGFSRSRGDRGEGRGRCEIPPIYLLTNIVIGQKLVYRKVDSISL